MATALVPLCLVAKLKDGRLIPVDVNQFRNSYLGVKALRLNFDKETGEILVLEFQIMLVVNDTHSNFHIEEILWGA